MSEGLLPAFEPIDPTSYELPARSVWRRKNEPRADVTGGYAGTREGEFNKLIMHDSCLTEKEAIMKTIEAMGQKFGAKRGVVVRSQIEAAMVVVALQVKILRIICKEGRGNVSWLAWNTVDCLCSRPNFSNLIEQED